MEIEELKSTPLSESTSAVNDKTEASNAGMEGPSYKEPGMSLGCAILTCLKKYGVFEGRARRSEFWWFMLFCFVVELVAAILFSIMFSGHTALFWLRVIFIALLVPSISVMFRRQHDAGILWRVPYPGVYTLLHYRYIHR